MKKIILSILTLSLSIAPFSTSWALPSQFPDTPTEQKYNTQVTGNAIPKSSMIDMDMPLIEVVAVDTRVETYELMFTSPESKIVNNSEDGDIKLSFIKGNMLLGGNEVKLVSPTFFSDWSRIDRYDSENYFALGLSSVGNWMDESPIVRSPVWLHQEGVHIGTVSRREYDGPPTEAEFKFTARHGISFSETTTIEAKLYFKAELINTN